MRVKYTRNGVNTTKDLKNKKNTLIWWNDVKKPKRLTRSETMSKIQKASHCETVKNPLGGVLQRNDVENPKGLSLRNSQKPVRGCTFIWGKKG